MAIVNNTLSTNSQSLLNQNLDNKAFKLAAKNGDISTVIRLSYICSAEAFNKALYEASCFNRIEVVKWFMTNHNRKVDICYPCRKKRSPLSIACDKGYLEIVELLIRKGQTTKINSPNNDGNTPLITACHNGHVAVSKLLIELPSVNMNIVNAKGDTALHYVIWCVKEFWTSLHKACDKNDMEHIEHIMYATNDAQKTIDAQDNKGNTPLHYTCARGHQEALELLMAFGADDTIANEKRRTPVLECEEKNHKHLIEFLDRQKAVLVLERRRSSKKLTRFRNNIIVRLSILLLSNIKRT